MVSRGEEGGGLLLLGVNSPEQWRLSERGEEVWPRRLERVEEGFKGFV